MEMRFHGAFRTVKNPAYLLRRETVDMSEHNHRSLQCWKLVERAFDVNSCIVATFEARIHRGHFVLGNRQIHFAIPSPLRLFQPIQRTVLDNAEQPGLEIRFLPEFRKRTMDVDERFLRNVVGVIVITEKAVGDIIRHFHVRLHKLTEGAVISSCDFGYEFLLLCRRHAGRCCDSDSCQLDNRVERSVDNSVHESTK